MSQFGQPIWLRPQSEGALVRASFSRLVSFYPLCFLFAFPLSVVYFSEAVVAASFRPIEFPTTFEDDSQCSVDTRKNASGFEFAAPARRVSCPALPELLQA